MSVKYMTAIWENGPERMTDRFVLLCLADYSNDAGECWPSITSIMHKTTLSERGVQTALRRLEAEGWLEIDTGKGRKNCNVYCIKTPQEMHPAGDAPPHMDAETPHMDAETPHMTAKNPAGDAPEPLGTVNEPSIDRAREKKLTAKDELMKVLDDETAQAVVDHRVKIKKPLTPYAASLLAKQFAACPDPIEAASVMVMNGWQGFRADWLKNQRGPSAPVSDIQRIYQATEGMISHEQSPSDDSQSGHENVLEWPLRSERPA